MHSLTKVFCEAPTPGNTVQMWHELDPATIFRDGDDVVQRVCGKETARWPHGKGIWMGDQRDIPALTTVCALKKDLQSVADHFVGEPVSEAMMDDMT